MEERQFFTEGGIRITSARAIFGGQTYSMANISSVRYEQFKPYANAAGFLFVFGLLGLLAFPVSLFIAFIGFICLVGCIELDNKRRYRVMLVTTGGEQLAFETPEEDLAARIVSAINDAIVSRG